MHAANPQPTAPLQTRLLIIEDEPLIALDLEDLLIDAGFAVVGVAATLEAAMAHIEGTDFDVAIVDANLGGVSSSPAATALVALKRPFIVLSGYSKQQQHAAFASAHFLQKPCRPNQLIASINALGVKR
jgi:DNA-binding response OmpR family regulator